MTSTKVIQTDLYKITMLSPYIFENEYFDDVVIDVALIDEIKKVNLELANGKPYGVLSIFGETTEVTSEAREYLASNNFHQNNLFAALLVTSLAQKIIANFYLRFNKPVNVTKAFSDKESALRWLSDEMNKHLESIGRKQD